MGYHCRKAFLDDMKKEPGGMFYSKGHKTNIRMLPKMIKP